MRPIGFRPISPYPFLVALLAVGGPSCSEDPSAPSVSAPRYLAPSSPENVLENFETAHRRGEIDAYIETLDETFVFRASPNDTLAWDALTYGEDVALMRRMFSSASSVEMRLTFGEPQPSTFLEYPAEEGYVEVQITNVMLRVVLEGKVDGEQIILEADHAALVVFREVEVDGETAYRIAMIQDQSTGTSGIRTAA